MTKQTARVMSCLALCLMVLASFSAVVPAAAQEPQPDPAGQRTYLPLIAQKTTASDPAAAAYSGRITYMNAPVAGHSVKMNLFDGVSWTVYASAVTDANGYYSFPTLPTLAWETRYYVTWENPAANPNWLSAWVCDIVDIYTYRKVSFVCSFDIQNVHLLSPGPADTLGLPITFTWEMRSQLGEDYELNIADITDFDPWWSSAPYREPVDWYRMFTQPKNLLTDRWYGWFVQVYAQNGYGRSFYYRPLIFTRTGRGYSAAPHLPVEAPLDAAPIGK